MHSVPHGNMTGRAELSPHQVDWLVLVKDTVACPLLTQELWNRKAKRKLKHLDMNIFSFGPSKLQSPGCRSGLTALWFQPIICQYTQTALSIKNKFDDLACCNTVMNSSTLKGSSATGLMDYYSRDRESSLDFMNCRRYLSEWMWKMDILWLTRQKKNTT